MVHLLSAQQPPWWQAHFPHPLAQHTPKSYGKPSSRQKFTPATPWSPWPNTLERNPITRTRKIKPTQVIQEHQGYRQRTLLPKLPLGRAPSQQILPLSRLFRKISRSAHWALCSPCRERWFLLGSRRTSHPMGVSCTQAFLRCFGQNSPAIVICKVDENVTQRTLVTNAMQGIGFNIAQCWGSMQAWKNTPSGKYLRLYPWLGILNPLYVYLPPSDSVATLGGSKRAKLSRPAA